MSAALASSATERRYVGATNDLVDDAVGEVVPSWRSCFSRSRSARIDAAAALGVLDSRASGRAGRPVGRWCAASPPRTAANPPARRPPGEITLPATSPSARAEHDAGRCGKPRARARTRTARRGDVVAPHDVPLLDDRRPERRRGHGRGRQGTSGLGGDSRTGELVSLTIQQMSDGPCRPPVSRTSSRHTRRNASVSVMPPTTSAMASKQSRGGP